jgi:hypothetical protein
MVLPHCMIATPPGKSNSPNRPYSSPFR